MESLRARKKSVSGRLLASIQLVYSSLGQKNFLPVLRRLCTLDAISRIIEEKVWGASWPRTLYRKPPDPCRPLPGLAGCVLIMGWKLTLQRVCCTAGLRSGLSSCHLRWAPAVEEEDYDVMYSIDSVYLTSKRRTVPNF